MFSSVRTIPFVPPVAVPVFVLVLVFVLLFVFNIIEFRFSKLPYQQQQQQYEVIGDAGYGYEIIQSAFNHKYSILTPQRKYLTKFVFDEIIGFHHSSSDFNTIYAIGFQENRVFAMAMI